MNLRGQIAIFIVVAVVIVGFIVLLFAISNKTIELPFLNEFNPDSFLSECVRKSVKEKSDLMITRGGFVNPSNFKLYKDVKASYLCEEINYYEPCVNQYPLYLTMIKEELKNNIEDDIKNCFVSLEEELISRNYDVAGGDINEIDVQFKPNAIEVVVYRDFSFSKNEVSRDFDSVKVSLESPLYGLANVALAIVESEAKSCEFDYVEFADLHREYYIKRWSTADSTKIYTIHDKKFEHEMNIAIRGCAIPAGF